FIVGVLFEDVRGPTTDAADGKDRRVEIERNSHHVVSRSRISIDIRQQSFLALHYFFHFRCHLVPPSVAFALTHFFRELTQMSRARIVCTIHGVAPSHNLPLVRQSLTDEALHSIEAAYLQQHFHHRGVRAAV